MASIFEDIKNEFRTGTMLSRIIIINAIVFLLANLLRLVLYFLTDDSVFAYFLNWLELPVRPASLIIQPWSLITYMFLHIGIGHIFFNMLYLYWFGKIFIEYLGDKKLLPVYLFGGLSGAFISILFYNLIPKLQVTSPDYILGASAAVLAIVVATATLLPEYTMNLLFFGPVKLKFIALIAVVIDVISIPSNDHTDHLAHLGGALFGYLFIKQLQKGNDWSKGPILLFDKLGSLFTRKKKMKVTYRKPVTDEDFNLQRKSKQEIIDQILDKISKSGYESLSKEEKEILFKMSKDN